VIGFFLLIAGVDTDNTDAHKPVTSKFDYNRDVFPLLREHCGRCHSSGGPGPMSLMTYTDAVPWGVSIRDELTSGRMPPWPVDPTSPSVKGGQPIGASDINMIIEWATGGNPEGDIEIKLPAVTFAPQWKLGTPDLKIPMAAEYKLAPGTMEEAAEFSLPVNVPGTKWVKAADLMQGTASIVRNAVISIENGPVLALWQPGSDPTAAPSGTAFKLESGSKIHVNIHYKKHFEQEQDAVSDKSTIGLYFTEPPLSGHELQSFVIDSAKALDVSGKSVTLTGRLDKAAQVVALRPMLDRTYALLNVDATTPSGTHIPLLRLRGPRPQWLRRYWLEKAVELARGTQIAVTVEPLADYSDELKVTKVVPLQVALDFVPQ
jgi:hypothetical protein